MIQGTQQIYVAFLWYWGATIDQAGKRNGPPFSSRIITSITVPVAVLMWTVGAVVYLGLPNYYRRRPGNVPSFYQTLFRRKTVLVRLKPQREYGYLCADSFDVVVLCHGHPTELFPVHDVQPQLEVSLEVSLRGSEAIRKNSH